MKYLRGCEIKQNEIADDFYEAYRRCFEAKNPKVDEFGIKVYEIVSVPGFVNGLFACELYLKCLLGDKLSQISKTRTHNLKSLYNKLDNDTKKILKDVQIDPKYKLEDLLKNIGNGFIAWRYIFEDGNEKFGDKHPFEYTEYFLKVYLPILKQLCSIDK